MVTMTWQPMMTWQVFNHMFRKPREWPGIGAPVGAWLMKGE